MDVSDVKSIRKTVKELDGTIDALILNVGGWGGRTPQKITGSGVTTVAATNILGHAVLVEKLQKEKKHRQFGVYNYLGFYQIVPEARPNNFKMDGPELSL